MKVTCPLTKHQNGIVYLAAREDSTIESIKKDLQALLQPRGCAFYGGAEFFVAGQGMSIPTAAFEGIIERFRKDCLEVVIYHYFLLFDHYFLLFFSSFLCYKLYYMFLGSLSSVQYEDSCSSHTGYD